MMKQRSINKYLTYKCNCRSTLKKSEKEKYIKKYPSKSVKCKVTKNNIKENPETEHLKEDDCIKENIANNTVINYIHQ